MNKFRQYFYYVRSTFWFVPGLIIAGAVALAVCLIDLSTAFDHKVLARWPLLFGASAAGSRGLLATIASSMITVAGVVFSITIVALSLASSQYTSRVLRNFMRDRINQTVLGVFVGIFAYCLVVLRTIRGGDEGTFVPSLAMLFGLLLGFVGIAFLIYFIHHIATSIQAAQILAAVSEETRKAVDHLFPDGAGEEEPDDDAFDLSAREPQQTISALRTGYIQEIDTAALLAFAGERGIVIRLERAIGEFLIEGTPVMSVFGAGALAEEHARRLASAYTVGRQRTVDQDAGFGIRQLVDVAMKALSPGINDTTTAVMCVDYLTAILVRLAGRRIVSQHRSEDGELRLLTRGPTFPSLVGEAYDQIRQNAGANVAVIARLFWSIETLAERTTSAKRRRVLLDHARALDEMSRRSIPAPADREYIQSCSVRVIGSPDANRKA